MEPRALSMLCKHCIPVPIPTLNYIKRPHPLALCTPTQGSVHNGVVPTTCPCPSVVCDCLQDAHLVLGPWAKKAPCFHGLIH
jgi:hypothetical protein